MGKSAASVAIDNFIKRTGLSADVVFRKLAFDGLNALLLQSPVDTGNFRAHWRVGVNSPDTHHDPTQRLRLLLAQTGAATPMAAIPPTEAIMSGNTNIPTAKFGDTIYITNMVNYGPEVDAKGNRGLNGGSSKQAPAGWVYQIVKDLAQSAR